MAGLLHYRIELESNIPFEFSKKEKSRSAVQQGNGGNGVSPVEIEMIKFLFPSTNSRRKPFFKLHMKRSFYTKTKVCITNVNLSEDGNKVIVNLCVPNDTLFPCYSIFNGLKQEIKNIENIQLNTMRRIGLQNMIPTLNDVIEPIVHLYLYRVDNHENERRHEVFFLQVPPREERGNNICYSHTFESIVPGSIFNTYLVQAYATSVGVGIEHNKISWDDISEKMKKVEYKPDNTCTICIEDQKEKEVFYKHPSCEHSFHLKCIKKWCNQGRSKVLCPNCRIEYK